MNIAEELTAIDCSGGQHNRPRHDNPAAGTQPRPVARNSGQKDSLRKESGALSNAVGRIDVEDGEGSTSNGRRADENGPLPLEGAPPLVVTRSEGPGPPTHLWAEAGRACALVVIARKARQGEIQGQRASAVLLGDSVLDLERSRGRLLGQGALRTPTCGPAPDQIFESPVQTLR